MNNKIVLFISAAAFVFAAGCGKKEEAPVKEPPTMDAKDHMPANATDLNAPEPTLVCQGDASKPKVTAFSGTKLEADEAAVEANRKIEEEAAAAARAKWAGKTFEEFLPTVARECGDSGKYIVSGDVAIGDVKQLREFFEQLKSPPPPPPSVSGVDKNAAKGALIIMTSNGAEVAWSATRKQNLTYCVSSKFNGVKAKVEADIAAAAGAWEKVANVKFVHDAAQDASCGPTNNAVLFDVRPVDVGGDYYARAFFPNEARANRNVLIDLSALFLTPGQDLTLEGVLRHELGHTLGFRHEHTRPESGTCFEDSNFAVITSYDSFSVMHYPQCNGGADWKLLLTARDKSGAACVYGNAPGFTIDTSLCRPKVILPVPTDTPETVTEPPKVLSKNEQKSYQPLQAKPGSVATITMKGHGASPGDPDLYVRTGALPRVNPPKFTCRPYLTGADESCELTVPAPPNNTIWYLVHGYAAGEYELTITYVRFSP